MNSSTRNTSSVYTVSAVVMLSLPQDCVRCTVGFTNSGIVLTGYSAYVVSTSPVPRPHCLKYELSKSIAPWIITPQYTTWPVDNGSRLIKDLLQGTLVAVSDGSIKDRVLG